jgi:hypothetical protein
MEPLDERAVRTSFGWTDPAAPRGKRRPKGRLVRSEETVPLEQRIDRAMRNLDAFVSRVAAG